MMTVELHERAIIEKGYTLVSGISSDDEAEKLLGEFGELIPQYDGSLRYQVKYTPGFEQRRYSKSVNTILVHTEAPGWDPPPAYLALHCRVQATCGSGHTELADLRQFAASLPEGERAALYRRDINWVGHNTGGVGAAGVHRPVVERAPGGREVFRFSYNLLTAGEYDPPLDEKPDPGSLPLGPYGLHLAEQVEAFFREHRVSVLIPEDSVLVWDNQRMVHARSAYRDPRRHLTRYWISSSRKADR